jgi:predicted transcriptional regulator
MPTQDLMEFLSDRIDCLETRFEARFDRLETRLDRWMEDKGDQDVYIQKNTDKIDEICRRYDSKSKQFLVVSIGIASCVATLLSAFIEALIKFIIT